MVDEMFWQTIVAYAVVIFAAFWLGRRIYRTIRAALGRGASQVNPACMGCPKSSANSAGEARPAVGVRPLVQLGRSKKSV